jgi:hypothetical protein
MSFSTTSAAADDTIVPKSKTPGKARSHHARGASRNSLVVSPHEAAPDGAPTRKKSSDASIRITAGTPRAHTRLHARRYRERLLVRRSVRPDRAQQSRSDSYLCRCLDRVCATCSRNLVSSTACRVMSSRVVRFSNHSRCSRCARRRSRNDRGRSSRSRSPHTHHNQQATTPSATALEPADTSTVLKGTQPTDERSRSKRSPRRTPH